MQLKGSHQLERPRRGSLCIWLPRQGARNASRQAHNSGEYVDTHNNSGRKTLFRRTTKGSKTRSCERLRRSSRGIEFSQTAIMMIIRTLHSPIRPAAINRCCSTWRTWRWRNMISMAYRIRRTDSCSRSELFPFFPELLYYAGVIILSDLQEDVCQ